MGEVEEHVDKFIGGEMGINPEHADALERVLDDRIKELEKEGHMEIRSMSFLSQDQEIRISGKAMAIAGAQKTYEEDIENATPEKVIERFNTFLHTYDLFRKKHGLSSSIDNVYEILAAMTDKLGRISRQVKHQERNDPKPDWPDGMTTEMAGLVVYMIILQNYYKVDISEGMKAELEKAVEQHS